MVYTKEDLRQQLVPMLTSLLQHGQGTRDVDAVTDTVIAMFEADRKATLRCALEIVEKLAKDPSYEER